MDWLTEAFMNRSRLATFSSILKLGRKRRRRRRVLVDAEVCGSERRPRPLCSRGRDS